MSFIDDMQAIVTSSSAHFSLYAIKTGKTTPVAAKISVLHDGIKTFMQGCLEYLITKQYSSKEFADYPHGAPKTHIEKLPLISDMISEQYTALMASFSSPETNNTNLEKYNSYAIVCVDGEEKTVFINTKRALKSYKKASFFQQTENKTYTRTSTKMLQLTYHFDCILSKSSCYIVTEATEKFFNLKRQYERKADECKNLLLTLNILSESDLTPMNEYLKKPGKYRALVNYDAAIAADIAAVTPATQNAYEEKYGISFVVLDDGTCHVDVSSEDKVDVFIGILTRRRAKDFENHPVESPTPFKIVGS